MSEYILKYVSEKQFSSKKEMDKFIREKVNILKIKSVDKHGKYCYVRGRIQFINGKVKISF